MSGLFFLSLRPGKQRLRQLFALLFFSLGISELSAHVNITTLDRDSAIISAIEKDLGGDGVEISNVVIQQKNSKYQIAKFSNGTEAVTPNIGISSGIVISTGDIRTLDDNNKDQFGKPWQNESSSEDTDLEELLNGSYQYDSVIITFDIKPSTENLTVDFVFGSDEYEKYINMDSNIVDAYGFFIREYSANGTLGKKAINAAKLPNGEPVSTKYVNHTRNIDYYIRNPDVRFNSDGSAASDYRGNHVALHAWTKVITGYMPVQSGKKYQVKIALSDGGDSTFDSSVFIGKFKSQRLLAGRVFQHTKGKINEDLLASGDQSFQYFKNTRVVLFDSNDDYVASTLTGSRGGYQFSVENDRSYRVAIDASTLTPGDHDADSNDLYPEQTWTSRGGQCANGQGGTAERQKSDYCYGGKTEARDWLREYTQNQMACASNEDPPKGCFNLDKAEHILHIPSDKKSYTNLNAGFSYDVVTHTDHKGQGSLINFIGAANDNLGTGKMLFVPVVPANLGGNRWRINQQSSHPLFDIKREGIVIDGKAWKFDNPEQPVNPRGSLFAGIRSSVQLPDLELTTNVNSTAFLRFVGLNQSVINTAVTGDNSLPVPLIQISEDSHNTSIKNNVLINNLAPGVVVTGNTKNNAISENHFSNNIASGINIPIDLKGNWIIDANTGNITENAPNKAIDRPFIKNINVDKPNQLTITGYAHERSKVEFYQLTHLGYQFLAAATEGSSDDNGSRTGTYNDPVSGRSIRENRFEFIIPLPDTELPSQIAAIAIDGDGNTSEFSEVYHLSATITATLWHDLNENGVQEADEPALAGINVELSSPTGKTTTLKSTDDNGYAIFPSLDNGDYTIHVPSQDGLNDLAPGANMSNPRSITISEKKTYGVPFGYITSIASEAVTITPEHRKSTAPGLFVHFSHKITSGSGSAVTLSTQWLDANGQLPGAGQQSTGWPVKLEKFGCDSDDNPGTPITGPLTFEESEQICFRASFFVPGETPQGVNGSLAIIANSTDKNVNRRTKDQMPAGEELARVIDQIVVTDQSSGRLRLVKTVTNGTQPGDHDTPTSNTAGSGDTLIYTIAYENIGAGPLRNLTIMSDTPAFTQLSEPAVCPVPDEIPGGLGQCNVLKVGPAENNKGFRGRIIWKFEGHLTPGAGGQVGYKLMVE